MDAIIKAVAHIEEMMQQEKDPLKQWKYRMVLAEMVRKLELLKSA
ncbi:hypothetical protein [Paenibacillus pectinilyticus]|nr:hypothetical protein [Paenibacillus pectinilyticus]